MYAKRNLDDLVMWSKFKVGAEPQLLARLRVVRALPSRLCDFTALCIRNKAHSALFGMSHP